MLSCYMLHVFLLSEGVTCLLCVRVMWPVSAPGLWVIGHSSPWTPTPSHIHTKHRHHTFHGVIRQRNMLNNKGSSEGSKETLQLLANLIPEKTGSVFQFGSGELQNWTRTTWYIQGLHFQVLWLGNFMSLCHWLSRAQLRALLSNHHTAIRGQQTWQACLCFCGRTVEGLVISTTCETAVSNASEILLTSALPLILNVFFSVSLLFFFGSRVAT